MKKSCLLMPCFIALTSFCSFSNASILWQGDFETGDMSQWNSPINAAGLSLTSECTFDGKHAGKVTLTGDDSFLWRGNKFLNRSEFHHRRAAGNTHEGKDTFFAFSFYLPQKFSEHKHELGYWESDKSWQQMFRFNIHGSDLSFQESAASDVLWKLPEGAAPGQWHRVALHIHWSTDPKLGSTEVWVNGKHMGKHHFKNLPTKDALMFTQIGILRTQEQTTEEILIDGALETDNLTELLERDRHLVGKTCEI
ncbi:polysaccharide lyase [Cellvibrio sp. UBA7661]|uniref:polysaccharide lyase n=1 Tax=Cellvibrio sp. UBA7661 TaxID=1946311 RepID=UPI002F35EEFE